MKVNPCPEITFLEESLIQMACEASSLNSLLNPRNQRVEFHVDFLGTIAGNPPISHHELIISKVLENLFDFVNPWFWKVKNAFLSVGGYHRNPEFIRLKDYNKFWVTVLRNNTK